MIISTLLYLLFLSFLTAIKAKLISLSKTLLLFCEEVSLGLLRIGVCVWNTNRRVQASGGILCENVVVYLFIFYVL